MLDVSRQSEGLVARIRQIRRALATPDGMARLRTTPPAEPDPPAAPDLQARLAHLEQLVQGLQDSVFRESQRHEKRIADLEARVEPGALASALSKDARDRGL